MVFSVFPNHMTTAMTSLQLASFWILPQVNNVAAYRINIILDQTQWVACLFIIDMMFVSILHPFPFVLGCQQSAWIL